MLKRPGHLRKLLRSHRELMRAVVYRGLDLKGARSFDAVVERDVRDDARFEVRKRCPDRSVSGLSAPLDPIFGHAVDGYRWRF